LVWTVTQSIRFAAKDTLSAGERQWTPICKMAAMAKPMIIDRSITSLRGNARLVVLQFVAFCWRLR
jgi:hypothetical protein